MDTVISDLIEIFNKDLNHLQKELELTPQDILWKTEGQVSNSPGNLFLHLTGNLQHFIGAVLGGSSYIRDREAEFGAKGLPKADLEAEIIQTKKAVLETLEKLTLAQLHDAYPLEVFGKPMTTQYFLLHLSGHLNYHLGQINYFRRVLDKGI